MNTFYKMTSIFACGCHFISNKYIDEYKTLCNNNTAEVQFQ